MAPIAGRARLSEPNAQSTDGPFATLERARDAVRDLKKSKSTDIVVLIREGTYQLEETVVFGLEDSGEGDSTITYAAYPGETPVFSSGREIKGWKKVTGRTAGPAERRRAERSGWRTFPGVFFTLYDAEGLLPRARSAGFIPLGGRKSQHAAFPGGPVEELAECGRCGNRRSSASRLDCECPAIGIGRRGSADCPHVNRRNLCDEPTPFPERNRIVLGRERAGGTRRAGRVGSEYKGRQALSLAAGRVARHGSSIDGVDPR